MWLFNQTVYQIYPLGFCNAPKENDGILVNRINHINDWIEYFKEIGVGSVLFNPVFQSDTHGYNTRNFQEIDCRLGTNQDFKNLCDNLHKNNIKIILDGVFNHVGRGFWAFKDVQAHKWDSKYKDWFFIDFNSNSAFNDGFFYEGWEGHYDLVKLNLKNPQVRDHIFESIEYWIENFGIDGLRLDVAYLLDHDFIRQLKGFVRSKKSDFPLIGEVLFGDYNLIVNDDMLDSCTNYECYKGIHSSFNSMNMFEISYSLNRQFGYEPWCIYKGKHLMNFIDNHDVSRIASILNNENHIFLANVILFTMPGFPCIYYGSEWATKGEKKPNSDDDLRPYFENPIRNNIFNKIKKLMEIKKSSHCLSYGGYKNIVVTNKQLVFERASEKDIIYIAINADEHEFTASANELNGKFIDLLTDKSIEIDGNLNLKAYEAKILLKK